MITDHYPNLGNLACLACMWEVQARKAGNVHPERDFAGLRYADFVASAQAIGPVFAKARRRTVGSLVLRAIQATRRAVHTNTNLGIVLLLAPLAIADSDQPLEQGVRAVLDGLTLTDSQLVFEAIRLAQPGGMGDVAAQDVREEPTVRLNEVMALAQDRDMIARQYVNGFHEVLHEGLPNLLRGVREWNNLEYATQGAHLQFIAAHADSLIVRKCGPAVAAEASRRAGAVLDAGWPRSEEGLRAFAEFDDWLRADGNRRNPGTSADLVTACIFAALRDNKIGMPLSVPWSRR